MRKYILLTFEDLLPQTQKTYDIEKLMVDSFKKSSLSIDDYYQAYFIIFVYEKDRKILKDRFV